RGKPSAEGKVVVSATAKGLLVLQGEDFFGVDPKFHGLAVFSFDREFVSLVRYHGLTARRESVQGERHAIFAMFVAARQHVQRILPTAEDEYIARGVRVGGGRREAASVTEQLYL